MKRAVFAALFLSLLSIGPLLSILALEQTPAPAGPAAAKTAGAPSSAATVEKSWPRRFDTSSGANITIFQPQIASWENQKHIVGYAAVSYLANAEAKKPSLGTIKLEA